MQQFTNITQNQAFVNTRKKCSLIFQEQLKTCLSNLQPGLNMLLLDRTQCPEEFLSKFQSQYCPNAISMGFQIKMVALYPKTNKNFVVWHNKELGQASRKVKKGNAYSMNEQVEDTCAMVLADRTEKNKDYQPEVVPFDGRLILNVCYRIISRKGHLTFLDEDNDHKLFTALSYVASYIGVDNLEQAKKEDGDFFQFVPVQYNSPNPILNKFDNSCTERSEERRVGKEC